MITALGLMSGTSLDGIDAAIIRTNGIDVELTEHWMTHAYSPKIRDKIRKILGGKEKDLIPDIEKEITKAHADVVNALLERSGMRPKDVKIIGFHGQTIKHTPEKGETWQIGDGALLARLTGIDVINDFRSNDMKMGGQGAPLVPLFHSALVRVLPKPVAILNIGGVANITYIGENDKNGKPNILAFDTGPGNAMLDDWVLTRTGRRFDQGGDLAAQGVVDESVLSELMGDPYFLKAPPKSLDRDRFARQFLKRVKLTAKDKRASRVSLEDGAATLSMFTAKSVEAGRKYFPVPPLQWYVTGGGRHNRQIMKNLAEVLPGEVKKVEDLGLNGEAMEAQAFAFLAARSLKKMPLTLPSTTGASCEATGGVFYPA